MSNRQDEPLQIALSRQSAREGSLFNYVFCFSRAKNIVDRCVNDERASPSVISIITLASLSLSIYI